MSADDSDRLIGRLPQDRRLKILDALAASSRGQLVYVEHSYWRKLDDTTKTVVGTILAVALHQGSGDVALVVKPADETLRELAIPAPHVLRVRAAYPYGKAKPNAHRLGEVLAGPPLPR